MIYAYYKCKYYNWGGLMSKNRNTIDRLNKVLVWLLKGGWMKENINYNMDW